MNLEAHFLFLPFFENFIFNHFIFWNDIQFFTTFTQLTARLKNFLRGWFLILGLKECLVECTTLCVKSEVMLTSILCSTILPLALSCAIFCESKSGSFFTWLIQSGRGKFSKQPIWKGIESWHASKENPPAQAKNAQHSTRPVNLHPLFLFWKHMFSKQEVHMDQFATLKQIGFKLLGAKNKVRSWKVGMC